MTSSRAVSLVSISILVSILLIACPTPMPELNNPFDPESDQYAFADTSIEWGESTVQLSEVHLSWGEVSSAISYQLEIDETQSFSNPTVTQEVSDTSYIVPSDVATDFHWRVRYALEVLHQEDITVGWSEWYGPWSHPPAVSDEYQVGDVTNLLAEAGDGEVRLTWTDPVGYDLSGIEVSWVPGSTEPVVVNPGTQSYVTTGLTNGTEYTFDVVVFDINGRGSPGTSVVSTPEVPGPGSIAWAYATTADVTGSSPAIDADGTIYIGSRDGQLYAMNPDGTLKWSTTIDTEVESTPAIGPSGTIYIGSTPSNLYAINQDGTQAWLFPTGGQVFDPSIASDGTIYVGAGDNNLYAINPDGTQQWAFATTDWVTAKPAIAADGTVYVGSLAGTLHAINPDGTEQWAFVASGPIGSSAAIAADGTIYVGSNDNNLYAINPDGTQQWAFATGDVVASSPAIGTDGTVYVGSLDNSVYAINPDSTLDWTFITGGEVWSSPAVGTDGTVYIGSWDNNVYAINPDGTEKWSMTTGDWISSSPAIGSDGTVYIGSRDDNIYAILGESGGLAETAWPMYGRDIRRTGQSSP